MNARWIFKGTFNTGDTWEDDVYNRNDFEFFVNRISKNRTICLWRIVEAKSGDVVWRSNRGFTGIRVPKYFKKILPDWE